ncbi:MAG: TonB-dependent receptor, partial [Pedobacter sp.]
GSYQGKKDLLRVNVFSGSETTYQSWNGVPEAKLRGSAADINDYIIRNGLSISDANNIVGSSNRTYNSFTYQDQTDNYWQDHYQALYATQLNNVLTLNGAIHYTRGKGYYEEFKTDQKLTNYGLLPVVIGSTTISRTDLVRRRWLDNDFYGFIYALNYAPSTNATFTFGGGWNQYKGDHFGQVVHAQFASNGDNSRHYYDNMGNKEDLNFYGKASIAPFRNLTFFADLQFRRIDYTVAGTDKNINLLSVEDKLNFFNPKFGFTFNIDQGQNVYGAFSIANKEPNRDDYINVNPGTELMPEHLKNIEIGYRFKNSAVDAGINAYGMYYRNQLVITGKINDVGEYFRQNVRNSYRTGLEGDISLLISDKITLNVNAAFSRNKIRNFTEFIDDYDNGGQIENNYVRPDISFSPSIVSGGEIVYNPFKGAAIALQSKYVSRQYLDNTENKERSLKAYTVSNIRLGYDLQFKGVKNLNIGLLANNIFNKMYESNGYTFGYFSGGALTTENFYFPQAGTNVLLALNIRF